MRFILFLFIPIFILSQEKNDETNIFMFALNYSYQLPEFDLKNRFGPNSAIGATFTKKIIQIIYFLFQGI